MKFSMQVSAWSLALLTVPLLCGSSPAATIHVPTAQTSIAAGLAVAADGDTVLVAPGVYTEHDLVLPSGVTLLGDSAGYPAQVVIDAGRAGRCLYTAASGAGTRVEGITLRNGLAGTSSLPDPSWGGGLYVDSGAIILRSCALESCEAAIGGGAFIRGAGTVEIDGCTFSANEATESAGAHLTGTCSPVLSDCSFTGATRTIYGGGLTWSGAGTLSAARCVFENNEVFESGGGMEVLTPSAIAVLAECRVAGNSAGLYAGGIDVLNGGTLEAHDVTFTGNTAPAGPDGSVEGGSSALLHCCDTDASAWVGSGTLTFDDTNCSVDEELTSWGSVKAAYR